MQLNVAATLTFTLRHRAHGQKVAAAEAVTFSRHFSLRILIETRSFRKFFAKK